MTSTMYGRRAFFALAAAVVGAAAVPVAAVPSAAAARTGSGHGDSARLEYQKRVVARIDHEVFEDGNTEAVDLYMLPDYIQHSPSAPNGTQALKNTAAMFAREYPDARWNIKRIISEGDYVLAHSNFVLTPGTPGWAIFDILRFQDGKIAEHWDIVQDVPEHSTGGHDMFSTESRPRTEEPGPRWQTEHSKRLVTAYFNRLLVKRDLGAIDGYVDCDYHEHDPGMADGVAGLKAGLGGYFEQFPQLQVMPKRMVAEGDLVGVHSHYVDVPGERGRAVLDLFRVRGGKIVEHWVTKQEVPETSANDNTMF
ncbi:nuclear transport factor 2 family protein [Streptomyces sp. NPDC001604]|uniref:nuclear transport factor 2 family protein n=1 Tax=Streptomyces sp. NPDC001604 TaxID=3364593 RepID=UPI0036CDDC78